MVRGRRIRRKKGPVQAKKATHDGINFASGLEKYMYIALKKSKIKALYEGQTFELVEGFDFPLKMLVTRDVVMAKVIIKIEEIKRSLI